MCVLGGRGWLENGKTVAPKIKTGLSVMFSVSRTFSICKYLKVC